jgi:hypothetical protein
MLAPIYFYSNPILGLPAYRPAQPFFFFFSTVHYYFMLFHSKEISNMFHDIATCSYTFHLAIAECVCWSN